MTQPSTGFTIALATTYPELAEQVVEGVVGGGVHTVVCILTLASRAEVMLPVAERLGIQVIELPIPTMDFRMDVTCARKGEYKEEIEAAADRIRKECAPELLLTFGFPMLPEVILKTPSRHAMNIHPADLPAYRGLVPLEAMILDDAKSMRLSAHHLTGKIDGGDLIAKSEVIPIPTGATTAQLWQHILDGVAIRLVLNAIDALWRGQETDQDELAYRSPDGGELPNAFGLKRVEVLDPTDDTMKRTNVGVLGKVRIEWGIDTAEDLERASRAFDGGMDGRVKLFTDYQRRSFMIDRLVILADPLAEESIVPGTILEVLEETTVVCATVDHRRVQLSGSFRKSLSNLAMPVLEVGEVFESTTPIALQTGFPMQGLERTVLAR